MPWEAWALLGLIAVMAFGLVRSLAGPDTILLGGVAVIMTLGLFSDRFPSAPELLSGLGNEGLITIGVLFVVAEGLSQTGAMAMVAQALLGRPRGVRTAQARLMTPVAALSAFLNNTPIVAMFMPVVADWSRRIGIAPSKLYIPLSYAAIMGGTCTLIGTATNLVVHGMVIDATQAGQLTGVDIGMFTVTRVGLPAAVAGMGYLLIFSPWLLPDRSRRPAEMGDVRQYTVEMLVQPGSPVEGKSIEQAGLRHLPGAYLIEIERGGERLVAVGPEQRLRGDDRLIFVGVVDSVVDLQKIRGLTPATDQVFKLSDPRPNRQLVEAVVSDSCPLVGKTIRDGRFRTRYGAVVIAVHRGPQHLARKIGDIVLHAGDTLLLETGQRFVDAHRNSRDFYLVSTVHGSQPVRHHRAWLSLGLLTAMVLAVQLTPMRLVNAALITAGLMVITGCCSSHEARQSVNWRVLLTIAAALALGKALETTEAAPRLAAMIVEPLSPFGPRALLGALALIGMVFTSMIGPVGAVALVFPIARAAADANDYQFTAFAATLMMTAATSFASPTGYQTNLMVYGPGGYRFSDFVRVGMPLNLITIFVTVMLAPWYWPM